MRKVEPVNQGLAAIETGSNVFWGVMTPHAAQSMLEARQMKIEWEARNEL